MTSDHTPRPRHPGAELRQQVPPPTANGRLGDAGALDALADAAAAFSKAADPAELARTLARRLARVASARRTTVWLVDCASPDELHLAAVWPPTSGLDVANCFPMQHAALASEALHQARVLVAPEGGSDIELALRGRSDAPLWVVPLIAGDERLGVAYLVAERPPLNQQRIASVLSILGTQAALVLRSLNASTAAQVEGARFLAIAAHDLKNTATSIKGYTQLLRRYLPADGAPRAERYSAVVEQQVGLLCDALVALVDFGRVQSGRLTLERERVDLREVLAAAQRRLPPAEDVRELTVGVPPDPVVGAWDRARLERALVAVLDNVRRGVHEECDVPLTLTTDDRQAELRVGALEAGERWPAPSEWAPAADMSLCLARGLVEAHGGTIGYRRTDTGQPLLHLTLPLEPPAT